MVMMLAALIGFNFSSCLQIQSETASWLFLAPALLLFGLLAGVFTFWLSPLLHAWSRRYEYQADAFAAKTMDEPRSLIAALRKLNEKNLSNLTPHPIYSGFYYSHPTLMERERALKSLPAAQREAAPVT